MAHPANLSSRLDHHAGFHFSLATAVAYTRPVGCTGPHIAYALPRGVFVDPYELDLRAHEYTYDLRAPPDLEKPLSAVDDGEPSLQVHVAPALVGDRGELRVEVPLHARYGYPSNQPRDEAYSIIRMAPPTAFWRCGESGMSPRCYLSSDLLMTLPGETLLPLELSLPAADLPMYVPIGVVDDLEMVESGTALAVLAAFAYLAFVFYTVHRRLVNRLYASKEE